MINRAAACVLILACLVCLLLPGCASVMSVRVVTVRDCFCFLHCAPCKEIQDSRVCDDSGDMGCQESDSRPDPGD